jgi:hypothetical protein
MWEYKDDGSGRDLRIDFMRGVVMLVLVIVHLEFFSLYNLFVWERVGVISGGEGFVLLAGLVVGMVYGKRMREKGWSDVAWKLFDRATQLYRVNVAIIFIILFLFIINIFDVSSVMSFTDRASGQVYQLYPEWSQPWYIFVGRILTLKSGPHQVQILGLYTILLMFAPLAIYLLSMGRTSLLLVLSWILYFYNWSSPAMPTGAQFEYGFPVFTWQLLFFHGMAVGYHRQKVLDFFYGRWGKLAIGAAFLIAGAFFFFAQNTPNPFIPSYAKISWISAEFYNKVYSAYCQKNTLGLLRLLNYVCFLIVAFTILTKLWKPISSCLGWFFIPLGQASLYVFIIHVFVVALFDNLIGLGISVNHEHVLSNTIAHTLALAILWSMVKNKVFYRWIPR